MKKILTLIVIALLAVTVTSCRNKNEIIIGTMTQPGEVILNFVKDDYEALGHKMKIVTFTDFAPINNALAEGSIHANLFQHEPYLNSYNESKNTKLRVAKKLYTAEYAAYTKKDISSASEIPNGKKVVIANDESNKSRCLYILQDAGLITLGNIAQGELANESHITANPKNLIIQAVSAANIPGILQDEDCYLGIVNATFALQANLHQTAKIIITENVVDKLVNANILACKEEDLEKEWLIDLITVLTSEETKDYINSYFNGTITAI